MTLSPQVQSTVRPEPSYAEAMEQLWVERYTGQVIVHFQSGQPIVANKLNPEKIRLAVRDVPIVVREGQPFIPQPLDTPKK